MELPNSMLIKRGAILHTSLFAEVIGHDKFIVIIGENKESYIGLFFINSNIHRHIFQRQELLNLQYLLQAKDYTFLKYDSFLSCTEIKLLSKNTLSLSIAKKQTQYKGMLQDKHLQEILDNVRNSKVFSKKEKEAFFY